MGKLICVKCGYPWKHEASPALCSACGKDSYAVMAATQRKVGAKWNPEDIKKAILGK